MQLLWFLDSSNPGRHSQATPPLGVSLQMWAQPWSLFMQLMPSVKQERYKSISILSSCVCRQQSQFNIHTQTKPLSLGRLQVWDKKFQLAERTGSTSSPAKPMAPRFLPLWSFLCKVKEQHPQNCPTWILIQLSHFILLGVHKTSSFLLEKWQCPGRSKSKVGSYFSAQKSSQQTQECLEQQSQGWPQFQFLAYKADSQSHNLSQQWQSGDQNTDCTHAVHKFSLLLTILFSFFFSDFSTYQPR